MPPGRVIERAQAPLPRREGGCRASHSATAADTSVVASFNVSFWFFFVVVDMLHFTQICFCLNLVMTPKHTWLFACLVTREKSSRRPPPRTGARWSGGGRCRKSPSRSRAHFDPHITGPTLRLHDLSVHKRLYVGTPLSTSASDDQVTIMNTLRRQLA